LFLCLSPCLPTIGDGSALCFGYAKPEFSEAFPEFDPESFGFVLILEAHNEVVGVPDHLSVALRFFLYLLLIPEVKNVMEIDISQHRAHNATLRSAFIRLRIVALFHDSGLEEPDYEAKKARVVYPLLQAFHHPSVIDTVVGRDRP